MRSRWTGVCRSWVFGRRVIWAVGQRDRSLAEGRRDLGFVGVLVLELSLSLSLCLRIRASVSPFFLCVSPEMV